MSKLGKRQSNQSRENRHWSACFHRRTAKSITNRRVNFNINGRRHDFEIPEIMRDFSADEEVILLSHLLNNPILKSSATFYAKIIPGKCSFNNF